MCPELLSSSFRSPEPSAERTPSEAALDSAAVFNMLKRLKAQNYEGDVLLRFFKGRDAIEIYTVFMQFEQRPIRRIEDFTTEEAD